MSSRRSLGWVSLGVAVIWAYAGSAGARPEYATSAPASSVLVPAVATSAPASSVPVPAVATSAPASSVPVPAVAPSESNPSPPPLRLDGPTGTRPNATVSPLSVRSWIVVETVKDGLRFEVILHVTNQSPQPLSPEGLELSLPEQTERFSTPSGDARPLLERRGSRVVFTTPLPSGLSQASFVAELPVDGRGEVGFRLGMMASTEEIQIGFLGPRTANLDVAGFPRLRPSRLPTGVPIVATGRTYSVGSRPVAIEAVVSGLPERGSLPALGLVLGLLLVGLATARRVTRRTGSTDTSKQQEAELLAARERLLDEVCRVERAREAGRIGPETARGTREELVLALLRIERCLDAARGPVREPHPESPPP